jgi:hypothetical protein
MASAALGFNHFVARGTGVSPGHLNVSVSSWRVGGYHHRYLASPSPTSGEGLARSRFDLGRHLMPQRLRVFELARELGVSIPVIIRVAESLRLPVRRGIAELTPRHEQLIRNQVERGGWRDRKRRTEVESKPYDVTPPVRYATCECCGLHFSYTGWQRSDRCEQCTEHFEIEGESADRTIARLEDHEQRLRERYLYASRKANEYEDRMRSAYESRQKWKAALIEVALGHEPAGDSKCTCGAKESPCATIRPESASRSVTRRRKCR